MGWPETYCRHCGLYLGCWLNVWGGLNPGNFGRKLSDWMKGDCDISSFQAVVVRNFKFALVLGRKRFN
jgi:hypothetical protein